MAFGKLFNHRGWLMAMGFALTTFSYARAQVLVEFKPPGGSFNVVGLPTVAFDGNNNLTITNPNTGVFRVQILAQTNLGTVTFARTGGGDTTGLVQLVIGDGEEANGLPMQSGFDDWAGVATTNGYNVRVQAKLNGALMGNVSANCVIRIDAASISGNITQTGDFSTGLFDIGQIDATNGNITGNVTAARGCYALAAACRASMRQTNASRWMAARVLGRRS